MSTNRDYHTILKWLNTKRLVRNPHKLFAIPLFTTPTEKLTGKDIEFVTDFLDLSSIHIPQRAQRESFYMDEEVSACVFGASAGDNLFEWMEYAHDNTPKDI